MKSSRCSELNDRLMLISKSDAAGVLRRRIAGLKVNDGYVQYARPDLYVGKSKLPKLLADESPTRRRNGIHARCRKGSVILLMPDAARYLQGDISWSGWQQLKCRYGKSFQHGNSESSRTVSRPEIASI